MQLRAAAVIIAAICAGTLTARATTVDAPTLRQMVGRADRIFVGEVIDVRSYRTGTSIHTDVTFRTSEVIKGRASAIVLLTFLGGTVGDDTLEVTGMPRFLAGEEQVVFSLDGERHMSPIVGVWHGRVRVARDPVTRTARVLRNDGTPFERAAAVSQRPAETSSRLIIPMRLEAFLDEVRQLLPQRAR
jgi:hypothetical protein